MELDFWMNKIQDGTQLKKSVVQSVLLCLSCLFIYILTSKFIKKLKKIYTQAKKKNIKSLNFAESNAHQQKKKVHAAALRHTIYFFKPDCTPTGDQQDGKNPTTKCFRKQKIKIVGYFVRKCNFRKRQLLYFL